MSNQVWTAGGVHDQLIKYLYTADKYVYLREVRANRGYGVSAIADAIAICLWPSRGHYPMGIEIKVSRSDWLSELRNVGKSDEIWQNCSSFEVAAPEGIVKKEELPKGWGLTVVSETGVKREVKPAHREDAIPVPGFYMSLLSNLHKDNENYISKQVDERTAKIHAAHYQEKNKIAEDLRIALNANAGLQNDKKLVDNVRKILIESGIGVYDAQSSPDRVIRELKEVKSLAVYHRTKESIIYELQEFSQRALALKHLYEQPPEVKVESTEHRPWDGDSVRGDMP